uniref:Uncharacterized protein n=1 Tax=Rhizophora mucronata TaxID=61149 RepID=A0A2P2PV94_RHIMU
MRYLRGPVLRFASMYLFSNRKYNDNDVHRDPKKRSRLAKKVELKSYANNIIELTNTMPKVMHVHSLWLAEQYMPTKKLDFRYQKADSEPK